MKIAVSNENDSVRVVAPQTTNLYSRHADSYDSTFGAAVDPSNERLTADLRIKPNGRILDLACGTASSSLAMARLASNGDIVCVDSSEEMLSHARERFRKAEVDAKFINMDLSTYADTGPSEAFDVITLRFGLTYFDWNTVLPRVVRLLRPGGRLGLVTNLADSLVQLQQAYRDLVRSPRPAYLLYRESGGNLIDTWRRYRAIRARFGTPSFIRVPCDLDEMMGVLQDSGLILQTSWLETRRLFFADGFKVIDWLFTSGCVAHAPLENIEAGTTVFLQRLFAHALEDFGTRLGVPLDMSIAGIVLVK